MSKFSAVIRDVTAASERKVRKGIIEFLITSGTYEFEFGSEAFVDSRKYRFVVTFGYLK